MLTTVIGFLAILSSWNAIEDRVKEYYAMFLLLQTGMIGVFMSLDFFLFYVFWELVLVPMYFIIGVWGGPRKLYAAIKFFLYTLAGTVLMLLGILTLYFQYFKQFGTYTFEISELMKLNLPLGHAAVGVLGLLHRLRHQGADVPVPHLAARRARGGAHGRFGDPGGRPAEDGDLRLPPLLAAAAARGLRSTARSCRSLAVLSIVGIIYGALVSLMQKDWKKLVAYSSVSHLGFCTLGIFALNPNGIAGSVIQQINHGISTGMLFLIVGVIYERRHTREIKRVRRPGARDAEVRRRVRHRDAEFGRAAAAQRLHRRVHDPAGRVRGQSAPGRRSR